MNTAIRFLAMALAALMLTLGSAQAAPQGQHGRQGAHPGHGHGHGHWHGHRHGWRGPAWGIGIGIGLGAYHGGRWYRDDAVRGDEAAVAAGPRAPAAPDPVFQPRNGQGATQTEADRQDCNRWATTQPSAMADALVFHRTTLACMEGRGYAVR